MKPLLMLLMFLVGCKVESKARRQPLGKFGLIQKHVAALCPKYTTRVWDPEHLDRTIGPAIEVDCEIARSDLEGAFTLDVVMQTPADDSDPASGTWIASEHLRTLRVYFISLTWRGPVNDASHAAFLELIYKVGRRYLNDRAALGLWDGIVGTMEGSWREDGFVVRDGVKIMVTSVPEARAIHLNMEAQ